jgi:hypothetical protein
MRAKVYLRQVRSSRGLIAMSKTNEARRAAALRETERERKHTRQPRPQGGRQRRGKKRTVRGAQDLGEHAVGEVVVAAKVAVPLLGDHLVRYRGGDWAAAADSGSGMRLTSQTTTVNCLAGSRANRDDDDDDVTYLLEGGVRERVGDVDHGLLVVVLQVVDDLLEGLLRVIFWRAGERKEQARAQSRNSTGESRDDEDCSRERE